MAQREVKHIQVGPTDDGNLVGFVATYTDGTTSTHLFAPSIALELARLLTEAVKNNAGREFSDSPRVEDGVKIKLN